MTRPDTPDDEALLTVEDVARLCAVSERTVWRWIAAQDLPAVRLGQRVVRVRRKSLAAFLRRSEDK